MLAIFVWFFIPETRKVSLEEIDVLFGGSNHVDKGADLLHIDDPRNAKRDSDGEFGHGPFEIKMNTKTVITSQGQLPRAYIRV